MKTTLLFRLTCFILYTQVQTLPAPSPVSVYSESNIHGLATVTKVWRSAGCVQGVAYGFYGRPLPLLAKKINTTAQCQKLGSNKNYLYVAMKSDVI